MARTVETFQLTTEQAEAYQDRFVPAIFAEWAGPLVELAAVRPGQQVLDVACGTGVVARAAADLVLPSGGVTGVDLSEAMLTVARRLHPQVSWQQGDAQALPLADDSVDVALCQAGLMFVPDATQALREMARVVRPGGTVGVQVFDSLTNQPGYGPWVEAVARHVGDRARNLLGTYWTHGDLTALGARFADAGLAVTATRTRTGTARYASVEEMIDTEIAGTPLEQDLGGGGMAAILADSERVLGHFVTGGGLVLPLTGHLVTATAA